MEPEELLSWIDALCIIKYDPALDWEGQEFAAEWLRSLMEETRKSAS
jgi:hypothetical protein